MSTTSAQTLERLRDLLSALDRRPSHPERPGESRIAAVTAELRAAARARVDALTAALTDRDAQRNDQSQSAMDDDGAPPR